MTHLTTPEQLRFAAEKFKVFLETLKENDLDPFIGMQFMAISLVNMAHTLGYTKREWNAFVKGNFKDFEKLKAESEPPK
jgi:hypothetical protein